MKKAIMFGVPIVLVVLVVAFFILPRETYSEPTRDNTFLGMRGMQGAQVRSEANRKRMLSEYNKMLTHLKVGFKEAMEIQRDGGFAAGYGPQRRSEMEMDALVVASNVVNGLKKVLVRNDDQHPGYAMIETGVLTLPYYAKTAKGNAVNMSRSAAAHHLLYAIAVETAKRGGASTTQEAVFLLTNFATGDLGWTYMANKQRPKVRA